MTHRLTTTELAIWSALAVAGGCAAAWLDASTPEVQGTVLVVMLVAFALTLPGRAPVLLVALSTTAALVLASAIITGHVNAGMLIAVVPALIGAGGGRLAGRLLDTAASTLPDLQTAAAGPWQTQPLSTRFLLAFALLVIAVAGLPSLVGEVRTVALRAPVWVAIVWQIATLLGWIALTPAILGERIPFMGLKRRATTGLGFLDLSLHLLAVVVLTDVHVVVLVVLSKALFIPLVSDWHALSVTLVPAYLPLDLLAYIAIVSLGFISDTERQRRDAAQREGALRAESLDSRLTALRARLNPHFLFNALNSVNVLARAGKTEETSRLVEGLTALLRYVLDDRRAAVSLREELDFAREYLTVQQVRFGARLRFDVNAGAGSDEAIVPQLLLQPIVENAVEHGVARALDGGTVSISAARDDRNLLLVVADDGPSIVAATTEPSFGIGLASTRERLDRLYGDRARLTIAHSQGGGTRVEITMPFETSL